MDLTENKQDREWMIAWWTQYMLTHSDKDWSGKQKAFIDMFFDHN
ncbi:MAG: hypothetical protein V1735_04840 [Nanoarchaeota archaeon]